MPAPPASIAACTSRTAPRGAPGGSAMTSIGRTSGNRAVRPAVICPRSAPGAASASSAGIRARTTTGRRPWHGGTSTSSQRARRGSKPDDTERLVRGGTRPVPDRAGGVPGRVLHRVGRVGGGVADPAGHAELVVQQGPRGTRPEADDRSQRPRRRAEGRRRRAAGAAGPPAGRRAAAAARGGGRKPRGRAGTGAGVRPPSGGGAGGGAGRWGGGVAAAPAPPPPPPPSRAVVASAPGTPRVTAASFAA